MDAIFRPTCRKFCQDHGSNGGRAHFMEWLAHLKKSPVPHAVEEFDDELVQLMTKCLLVCSRSERRTCAETLDAPYLASHEVLRTKSSPIKAQAFEEEVAGTYYL